MKNPIGWFEIYVQDMDRAKAFYEGVFDVQLSKLDSPDMEILAFPMKNDSHGATGALVKMPGVPSGGNSVLVYFHSDDCAVEAAKVVKAGGKIEKDKFAIGQYGFR